MDRQGSYMQSPGHGGSVRLSPDNRNLTLSPWAIRVCSIVDRLKDGPLPLEVLTRFVGRDVNAVVTSATIRNDITQFQRFLRDSGSEVTITTVKRCELSQEDERSFRDIHDREVLRNRSNRQVRSPDSSFRRFLVLSPRRSTAIIRPMEIVPGDLPPLAYHGAGDTQHVVLDKNMECIEKALIHKRLITIEGGQNVGAFEPILLWWDGRDHHVILRSTSAPARLEDHRLVDLSHCADCPGRSSYTPDIVEQAKRMADSAFEGIAENSTDDRVARVVLRCRPNCLAKVERDLRRNKVWYSIDPTQDGLVHVRFETRSHRGLIQWVIGLDQAVELMEPQSIRVALAEKMRTLIRRYEGCRQDGVGP